MCSVAISEAVPLMSLWLPVRAATKLIKFNRLDYNLDLIPVFYFESFDEYLSRVLIDELRIKKSVLNHIRVKKASGFV